VETLYLDTHVVVWLFAGEIDKISDKGLEQIEACELLISPMGVLELEFLHEIGRLNYRHDVIIASLAQSIDLKVCSLPFDAIAMESMRHNWTRNPFDRLIVANAARNASKLLSRDRKIQEHFDGAIW
jgi:PIN domain nuclease of toxin-antitoxin system